MDTETTKPVKRWITVKQASERVPWTYKHLLKMIDNGKLPPGVAVQPGGPNGRVLVDSDAFDQWIENGCFTVGPGNGDGGKVADRTPQ
jgi:excisionase family DNA binding protein